MVSEVFELRHWASLVSQIAEAANSRARLLRGGAGQTISRQVAQQDEARRIAANIANLP
jgi:hypothetical protein